jgi:chorismate synthase
VHSAHASTSSEVTPQALGSLPHEVRPIDRARRLGAGDLERSARRTQGERVAQGQRLQRRSHGVIAVGTTRKDGSSLGAVVECVATGVPAGWGAPIYAKLDADLAAAMMGINAVKGVEIGEGMAAARLRGEQNADPMRPGEGGNPEFLANHAGGIAGGISTGQPVVVRVAFKPTSSILIPQETVTREGEATELATKGRHDPCVGIRGTPVVEAMMALVLADHKLLHRAQCGS